MENFLKYQADLTAKVSALDDVIGLIFLGSAADHSRVDQYSDQDFFLVVKPGCAEAFRQNLDWLPNQQDILLAPRETDHGLKVLYKNGLILEFAVFEDSELELATVNDYLVALDKQDIVPRMEKIRSRSNPKPFDFHRQFELVLSLVVIGVGRARRGETIAADQHIKSYAVEKLLGLVRSQQPVGKSKADSLNSFRRFEFDYPNLSKHIAMHTLQPAEICAKGLVHLINTELELNQIQQDQLDQTKQILGWS